MLCIGPSPLLRPRVGARVLVRILYRHRTSDPGRRIDETCCSPGRSVLCHFSRARSRRASARALEPPGAPPDQSRRRSSFWYTSERPLAPAGPTYRAQPPPPPQASRTCSYESCGGAVDGLPNSQASAAPPRRRKGHDVRRAPERARGTSGFMSCARGCRACRNVCRGRGAAGRRASTP